MTSHIRTKGSRFKLGDDFYEIPLAGEFNVRNAAMAATAARFYDVPKAKIDSALKTFQGNRSPAGATRRSGRRKSYRRFRASSDRDRANITGIEASFSGPPAVGDFRTALEHDAPRGVSERTAGSV